MSLLNTNFHIIESYRKTNLRTFNETQPTSGLALLMKEFTKTNDIWYCMITTPESLSAYSFQDLMSQCHYDMILNKTAYLVIDLPFEPFYNCIDNIYKIVVLKDHIPASQIIFMSTMYDAPDYSKEVAKTYGCEPINTFYFSSLEYMISTYVQSTHIGLQASTYYKNLDKNKKYPKAFLNFNRRWRTHRPMLVLLMWHKRLLDKGYVSFGPAEDDSKDNWEYIWNWMLVNSIGNQEMRDIILASEEIKNMPFLYLDVDDLHINQADHTKSAEFYYKNSYFSVISETTYYYKEKSQNSRFITEKTFKAIAMKHPFLLVSIPKSLEVLRHLGYKTFSPWIDESYDQEIDDNKRMLMIVNEIERLSNLDENQLAEFIDNVVPICEHNYKLLKDRKTFIYRDYLDAL